MIVQKKMVELQLNLEREYGEQPLAFLLGPTEYLGLCEELAMLRMYSDASELKVTVYAGLPVWQKNTDGIDLLIPLELTLKILGRRILNKE